jgi:TRAP-type C4-dicarboxylate transport system permease small subunit
LSSVSVVLNSLLLRFFHPKKRNWLSIFAPILMTSAFLIFFWNFAHLGNGWNFANIQVRKDPMFQENFTEYITNSPNKL